VAGHPLGHGGGSATSRLAGLGVVRPPPDWPVWGWLATPCLKKKKKKKRKRKQWWPNHPYGLRGGRATPRPAGLGHPHGLRGGRPPPMGWFGYHCFFFLFFFFKKKTGGGSATPNGVVWPPLLSGFILFLFLFLL
jgi:hypothetical protein